MEADNWMQSEPLTLHKEEEPPNIKRQDMVKRSDVMLWGEGFLLAHLSSTCLMDLQTVVPVVLGGEFWSSTKLEVSQS